MLLTMLEILSGKLPFYQYKYDFQVVAALQRHELPIRPDQEDGFAECIWDYVLLCWTIEPGGRPTCSKIRCTLERLGFGRRSSDQREVDSVRFRAAVKQSKLYIDYKRVSELLIQVRGHLCQRKIYQDILLDPAVLWMMYYRHFANLNLGAVALIFRLPD